MVGVMHVQSTGDMRLVTRRLLGPALAGEVLGGVALIAVMILVMGAAGMGYASPLNLGIPAFVFTITPALSMLTMLMSLMGIHLPPAAMAQLSPALRSRHISGAMACHLGGQLLALHVPPAKVQMIGLLITSHATNSTVASLLSALTPPAPNPPITPIPLTPRRT